MSYRILLLYLLLFLGFTAGSQPYLKQDFKHYSTRDGLSNNNITGITEDSLGFIWIATFRGLNRFDGNAFKQFLFTGKKGSLPDNSIFAIQQLPGNRIGIATDDGAQVIFTKTLETLDLNVPNDEVMRYWSNACRDISVDKYGNYGVSTKTGFYIFSPKGKLLNRVDRYTTQDIGQAWMLYGREIYNMSSGDMMQENDLGFTIYDHESDQFSGVEKHFPSMKTLLDTLTNTRDHFVFLSPTLIFVCNTRKNRFEFVDLASGITKSVPSPITLQQEIGWQTRLTKIDSRNWVMNSKAKGFWMFEVDTVSKEVILNPERFFGSHKVNFLFHDKKKRLWIGTPEGLFMQQMHNAHIQSFNLLDNVKYENDEITSMLFTRDRIYAGTYHGQLLVFDKASKKLIRQALPELTKITDNRIMNILPYHEDTLWVITFSGMYWLDNKNYSGGLLFQNDSLPPHVFSVAAFKDSRENIWISSTRINRVYLFEKATRKLHKISSKTHPLLTVANPNSFAEDKEGNIWIGGDAMVRWNYRLNNFDTIIERLPTQRNRKKGYTVMQDSNKDVWCTINSEGFARLNPASPLHLRPTNLFQDNFANVHPSLHDDRLLIAAINGIGFVNTVSQQAYAFYPEDGVPTRPITTYQFAFDSTDKSVWFASYGDIYRLPSRQGTVSYTLPPKLLISELAVVNSSIFSYPPEKLTLGFNENDINITLSAINYNDPQNMRFAYRFKNKKDSSWIDIGRQQNILLTNISPGLYGLQVKVYAFDNKWPEQIKEISIRIKPPFYKTPWFYLLVFLLLCAVVWFLYQLRIRQINQRANLDKLVAQTEMKALHAQMNPHFVFNCLNSIGEMILNNENRQASHYLSKFAQLIRITLNQSSKPFISLEQTIDYLRRYLEMEQIRVSHFTYTIHVSNDLQTDSIFIPPMLIQPFIENAIWHGTESREQDLKVDIGFTEKDHVLICTIEDNGIGIETSLKNKQARAPHQSLGIANIRQRIQVLNEKYNLQATLSIEDKSNLDPATKGTLVTLHLPIKKFEL